MSVFIVGLSQGARNVLPYTKRMMQNFLSFRVCPIIELRRSPKPNAAAGKHLSPQNLQQRKHFHAHGYAKRRERKTERERATMNLSRGNCECDRRFLCCPETGKGRWTKRKRRGEEDHTRRSHDQLRLSTYRSIVVGWIEAPDIICIKRSYL